MARGLRGDGRIAHDRRRSARGQSECARLLPGPGLPRARPEARLLPWRARRRATRQAARRTVVDGGLKGFSPPRNVVEQAAPQWRQRPAAGNCASVLLATVSRRDWEIEPGLTVPRLSARQSTRTEPGSSTSISRPPSTLDSDSTFSSGAPLLPETTICEQPSLPHWTVDCGADEPACSCTVVCVTSRTPTR